MDNMKNPWCFLFLLVLLCFFVQTKPSLAAELISANQTLTGDQTLISSRDVFELGFFKPGNSSNYYLGIWYKKVSQQTVVWVANRDKPVSDKNSAKLVISYGNLVLFDESHITVWSTNLNSTTSNSVVAVLLDSGNLVLRDKLESSENLWQSFDNPTDTSLPGSKIKLNNKTKQPQYLSSWKSKEDPAPGLFSLELDPRGTNSFLLFWNKSEQYWTSGPWNGQIFSLVPEMGGTPLFNFTFVSNENESYFTYSMRNTSIMTRLVMDVSGQIQLSIWIEKSKLWNIFWARPRRKCEVYAFCGAFGSCIENFMPFCTCLTSFKPKSQTNWDLEDHSGGCVRKTKLQCENPSPSNREKDRFLAMPNMASPKHAQSVGAGNARECESSCMNSCSCSAYAYDSIGCFVWHGDLLNLQQLSQGDSSGETLYLKLAASEISDSLQEPPCTKSLDCKNWSHSICNATRNETGRCLCDKNYRWDGFNLNCIPVANIIPRRKSSQNPLALKLGVTFSSMIFLACSITSIYFWRRKIAHEQDRKKAQKVREHLYDSESYVKDLIDGGRLEEKDNQGIEVPYFDFESILLATDNFSDANRLGRGGYGPVYKGKLPTGQDIAVKRLSHASTQGLDEFKNEVVLIAKLQHRNLVRLRGYCISRDEKILLYEYMPNKSLDSFIFDRTRSILLDWKKRFAITLGVARGLLYLHQDSRLKIIHRDLKTSNILLDEEMKPKISDFGLARIFPSTENEANTENVVGTYGYMSPEYALDGLFSVKSDVFSFGVVLLEIISGKKNSGFYQSNQDSSLLGYAWRLWTENKVLDLMDETMRETSNNNANQFIRCAHVGLLCVQNDPSDRPTMSNVVTMLDSEIGALPSPKEPTFFVRRGIDGSASPSDKPETIVEIYEGSSLHGR